MNISNCSLKDECQFVKELKNKISNMKESYETDAEAKFYDYVDELEQQCKKQKEVIDDCKEDISNLLDIISKNCNELKCTSDEWLVIQKYQDKEVSE